MKATLKSMDNYIYSQKPEIIPVLEKIRETIKAVTPKAIETIYKGVPTFMYYGKLVQFSACKNHIGFYPGLSAIEAFEEELSDYFTKKGTIKFLHIEPIPYELITNITKLRAKQNYIIAQER